MKTTKLIRLAHDSKTTLCSLVGLRLRSTNCHPQMVSRIPVVEEQTARHENQLEGAFYGAPVRTEIEHPAINLFILKDVWVTGSEGHIFFGPRILFSICPSTHGVEDRKIRRPIAWLSKTIEEPIFVLSGRAPGNRGHFLVEHMPRLIAGLQAISRLGQCKILVTPDHRGWQVEYLEKLGFEPSDVIEGSLGSVFCKTALYVPLLSCRKEATISLRAHYEVLREKLAPAPLPPKGFPIFLARKDAPDRNLVNEEAIFRIAQDHFPGLRSVTLSGMRLEEQIRLFQQAPVVIGPHGQPFRNLLFCNDTLSIQLLQGCREASNEYYHWAQNYNWLGNMFGNRCISLFSDIAFHKNSNWIYPEDKLVRDLSKVKALLCKLNERVS